MDTHLRVGFGVKLDEIKEAKGEGMLASFQAAIGAESAKLTLTHCFAPNIANRFENVSPTPFSHIRKQLSLIGSSCGEKLKT